MLHFEVQCKTEPGQKVGVCGSGTLGNWNIARSLILSSAKYPLWTGQADIGDEGAEFKYVLLDGGVEGAPLTLARWEGDFPNRSADPTASGAARLVLHHQFGDPEKSCVEVVVVSTPSETSPAPPAEPPASAQAASVAGNARKMTVAFGEGCGGLLEQLDVEPMVKSTRIRRASSCQSFEVKYDIDQGKVLGTGMSGGVVAGRLRSTGALVAIKTLSTDGQTEQTLEQVMSEVQNQLSMDHPNICRLLEVFEAPGRINMVMERMQGPDMYDHISRKGSGRYYERDAANYIRQMTSAVAYCHKKGVCHRDLKLENFCLEDDSENARVKLIDFGLSEAFTSTPMTNSCGTLFYVAPEVLARAYNEKCDLWSLGVIAYIMLDGGAPFHGRDDRTTLRLIRQCSYTYPASRWNQISKEAKDFISSLLVLDVDKRLDAEQALAQEWFAKALSEDAPLVELDPSVLKGMRNFTKSNAVKRAVLNAVAPVATAERVSNWANQFAALDKEGTGFIAVHDLADRLMELGNLPEDEAEELSTAMASTAQDGSQELISYSDFLAACLSAHMTALGGADLAGLFKRLDKDNDGLLSIDDVRQALGSISAEDMEELTDELDGKMMNYNDFRWLLLTPRLGPSVHGMRALLSTYNDLTASWRVDTKRAKAKMLDEDEELEAKRRENATWRLQHMHSKKKSDSQEAGGPSSSSSVQDEMASDASPYGVAVDPDPDLDGCLLAQGWKSAHELSTMTREEKRSFVTEKLQGRGLLPVDEAAVLALSNKDLVALCPACEQVAGDLVMEVLGVDASDPHLDLKEAAWTVATAEAKELSDGDACRRENLAWRAWHMASKGEMPTPRESQGSFCSAQGRKFAKVNSNPASCKASPSGSPRPGDST